MGLARNGEDPAIGDRTRAFWYDDDSGDNGFDILQSLALKPLWSDVSEEGVCVRVGVCAPGKEQCRRSGRILTCLDGARSGSGTVAM